MKQIFVSILAVASIGCSSLAPVTTPSPTATSVPTSTPSAMASPTATASPSPAESPILEALTDPKLTEESAAVLKPLAAFTSADSDKGVWWTESGISDNYIRSYASSLEPSELEPKLLGFLSSKNRKSALKDGLPFLEIGDSKVYLYQEPGGIFGALAVVSPKTEKPPEAWTQLGFPTVSWEANADALKDQKTVVMISTGYELAVYMLKKLDPLTPSGSPTPKS
jgi:hypothetical protein